MEYILLVLLWFFWCFLHSFLIHPPILTVLQRVSGGTIRYHRLFFNSIACFTLIPIVIYRYSFESPLVYEWQGPPVVIRAVLLLVSLFLFMGGAAKYDFKSFLGIAQIQSGNTQQILTESGKLDTSGVLRITRHPWYTGGILFLWSYKNSVDLSGCITSIVLTLYLIIGAYLEEKKLITEFGEEYRRYQQSVSMLFPVRWIVSMLGGKRTL